MQTRCLFRCGLALAAALPTPPLCATGSSLEGPDGGPDGGPGYEFG